MKLMRDFRLSRRWNFSSRSLGGDAVYCCCHSEDGGGMDTWNFDIPPHHYAASQPRRPRVWTYEAV